MVPRNSAKENIPVKLAYMPVAAHLRSLTAQTIAGLEVQRLDRGTSRMCISGLVYVFSYKVCRWSMSTERTPGSAQGVAYTVTLMRHLAWGISNPTLK